jgi:hypothetical protein
MEIRLNEQPQLFLFRLNGHTRQTKSNRRRRILKIILVDYSPPAWIDANALQPTTEEPKNLRQAPHPAGSGVLRVRQLHQCSGVEYTRETSRTEEKNVYPSGTVLLM